LLKGGAKVDSLDGNLETPLFRAVHSICADQADTDSVVALLLDHGANPNAKSTDGWTPLFWAVQRNNLLVAKLLLQKGADSAIADQDGKTPLSLAVEKKNRKMIELLLGPKDAADTATKPSSSAPTDPHSRQ